MKRGARTHVVAAIQQWSNDDDGSPAAAFGNIPGQERCIVWLRIVDGS